MLPKKNSQRISL
jgi:hypothetical protein